MNPAIKLLAPLLLLLVLIGAWVYLNYAGSPKTFFFRETGYSFPNDAQNIVYVQDNDGFLGDGDQILYFKISKEDVQQMIAALPPKAGFSPWQKGPRKNGNQKIPDQVPVLPFGTGLTNAPKLRNSDSLIYSLDYVGPDSRPSLNYVYIYINTETGEVLVHRSDS